MEVATSHEEKPNMVQEGGVQGRTMEGRVVKKWSVCRPSNGYVSNLDTYPKSLGERMGHTYRHCMCCFAHSRQSDIGTNAHNHNEEDSFVYNCIDSRIIHWHVVSIVDDLQNRIPKPRCNNVFASASTNIPQKFHYNHRGCIVTGEE